MTNSVKRPWQGTTLGVFAIIWCVGLSILTLLMFFLKEFILGILGGASESLANADIAVETNGLISSSDVPSAVVSGGLEGMISGYMTVIAIILLALAILWGFIARGNFIGKKWSLIVYFIFLILGILGGLSAVMNGEGVVSFALNVALAVFCVQMFGHPFYNKGDTVTAAPEPAKIEEQKPEMVQD